MHCGFNQVCGFWKEIFNIPSFYKFSCCGGYSISTDQHRKNINIAVDYLGFPISTKFSIGKKHSSKDLFFISSVLSWISSRKVKFIKDILQIHFCDYMYIMISVANLQKINLLIWSNFLIYIYTLINTV